MSGILPRKVSSDPYTVLFEIRLENPTMTLAAKGWLDEPMVMYERFEW